jgi:hypothetical protein
MVTTAKISSYVLEFFRMKNSKTKTRRVFVTLPYVSSLDGVIITCDGRFGAQAPVYAIHG